MAEQEDFRLQRIEEKVDLLTDAISKLAVVDARLTDYIASNSRQSVRVAEVEKALATLNTTVQVQGNTIQALSKITWGLGFGIATTFGTLIMKVIGLL